MTSEKEKYCPKCNEAFECKAEDILNCQCSAVQLSAETRLFLSQTYFGCLCKKCLVRIDHLVQLSNELTAPSAANPLKEGLHYYKENGNWVFTEVYHMLRGSCCGNGCRHCPYGFRM
jgi:hypothetical protein